MQGTPTMRPEVTAPSPAAAERLAMRELRQAADPESARRSAAYFKKGDVFMTLGVRAAKVRSVARAIASSARDSWGIGEAIAF